MSKDPEKDDSYLDDGKVIAEHNRRRLYGISDVLDEQSKSLTPAIASTEKLLSSLGIPLPERMAPTHIPRTKLRPVVLAKSWDELLAEAKKSTPDQVDFNSLLTQGEIDAVLQKHASIGSELDWFSTLDRYDLALSVAAGVIAGVVDVLLVGIPAHPAFVGIPKSEGGWLSNLMKEKTGQIFPADKIRELEKAYPVPYDPSTNRNLHENIAGLYPKSHRFHSLGHDPLLGFIFGVRDILAGEFTAIGGDGHLIVQQVAAPFMQGEQIFVRILEAMKIQFGHLASDIATPAGLPAPLMPLLLFFQFGKIGNKSHTIAEMARFMYLQGYDFQHFMASSVPVMITEVIIRVGYFIRSIHDGKTLAEAVPSASSIKLRRQLLIAHSVATLINAGKVYVTQDPFAISWAQALAFLRYVMPELAFLLHGKEAARSKMVEKQILDDYRSINAEFEEFLKTQDDFVLVV